MVKDDNSIENVSDQVRYFNDNKNFSNLYLNKVKPQVAHKQSKTHSDYGGAQESLK